jgi:hypothetical protein
MLRKSILILFVLFTFSVNANVEPKETPMDNFIAGQIETLELELGLFGTPINDGIISIESIQVLEIEEEIQFDYDTSEYLPLNFNANEGKNLDWSSIELLEVEEDVKFNFNVKAHLPSDFNPYIGMTPMKSQGICLK